MHCMHTHTHNKDIVWIYICMILNCLLHIQAISSTLGYCLYSCMSRNDAHRRNERWIKTELLQHGFVTLQYFFRLSANPFLTIVGINVFMSVYMYVWVHFCFFVHSHTSVCLSRMTLHHTVAFIVLFTDNVVVVVVVTIFFLIFHTIF